MDQNRVSIFVDQEALRDSVATRLRDENFEVTALGDDRKAIEALAKQVPASIIYGLTKPAASAAKFCRAVRRHAKTHEIPIVVLVDGDVAPFPEKVVRALLLLPLFVLGALPAPARQPSLASRAKAGGRDRDRTCDPYDVNVVLSR